MSLELCILASGSSGNSAILRAPGGAMLIDLGIGPRTTAKRLEGTGLSLADISAVCLTHLDSDHFRANWIPTLIRQQIRVFCHLDKMGELIQFAGEKFAAEFAPLVQPFDSSPFSPLTGICVQPIHLAHDRLGSHGFVAEGSGFRLGYATDLGHVPAYLYDHFHSLNLLAIESNYDPQMQENSGRPWFLRRRITGGHGHLSNLQALAAVKRIMDRSDRLPDHVVLLHRSRQCNCPHLLRKLFSQDCRIAPRLTLAEPFTRSEWLRRQSVAPSIGEQLTLAW